MGERSEDPAAAVRLVLEFGDSVELDGSSVYDPVAEAAVPAVVMRMPAYRAAWFGRVLSAYTRVCRLAGVELDALELGPAWALARVSAAAGYVEPAAPELGRVTSARRMVAAAVLRAAEDMDDVTLIAVVDPAARWLEEPEGRVCVRAAGRGDRWGDADAGVRGAAGDRWGRVTGPRLSRRELDRLAVLRVTALAYLEREKVEGFRADVLDLLTVMDRLLAEQRVETLSILQNPQATFQAGSMIVYQGRGPAMTDAEQEWLRTVGMRIRLARVVTRETQDGLAERAGVSRVTLGSIERGDHPAVVLTYVRLARTLGLSLDELLADTPRAGEWSRGSGTIYGWSAGGSGCPGSWPV